MKLRLDNLAILLKNLNFSSESNLVNKLASEKDYDIIEECFSMKGWDITIAELLPELDAQNIKYKILQKLDGQFGVLLVYFKGTKYAEQGFLQKDNNKIVIAEDLDDIEFRKTVDNWLSELDEDIWEYVEQPDWKSRFWSRGGIYYHATDPENIQSILENGIEPKNKTRGLSNKGIGSAVFVSSDPEEIGSHGNAVFAIDIGAMSAAGIRYPIQMETGLEEANAIEAFAQRVIGIEYQAYREIGLSDNTVVIYGKIPSEFLKLMDY